MGQRESLHVVKEGMVACVIWGRRDACVQLQKREASCLIGHKADGNSSSDKKVQAGFPSPALPCPALPGPSGVRPGSSCFCTRWAWYGVPGT